MIATELELAYVAGFFDGEGYCGLNRQKYRPSHYRVIYDPNVIIVNTKVEVLRELQRILQLGTIPTGRQTSPKGKVVYALDFPQHHIVKFLRSILPYLRIKKDQALLIIEFCETLKVHRDVLTEEQALRRQVIYEELTRLNAKGI